MKETIATRRLDINLLSLADAAFLRELVNSPGWIRFIGNRNIDSDAGAETYIQKILDSSRLRYWTVRLRKDNTPIGIITFIKRDYLDHHDIGFAFLPAFTKKGYAYEATSAVLDRLQWWHTDSQILATALPENTNSIRLLEKLGFAYQQEINHSAEILHVYAMTVNNGRPSALQSSF